jgi:hypothetical protein
MNEKRQKKMKILLILILVLSFNQTITRADLIDDSWSDNFDDGDYDGWTITGYDFTKFFTDFQTPPDIIPGNYSADDKTLLSIGPHTPGRACMAGHPSNVGYGKWSFDLIITPETVEHFYVYFNTDDWSTYPMHINSYDLAIVMAPGQAWSWELEAEAKAGFVLVKRKGGLPDGGWVGIGSHSVYEELSGTIHVDITRDMSGLFKVYIDGEKVIEAKDSEHGSLGWFRFTGEPGPAIDNVVVSDHVDYLSDKLDLKITKIQNDFQSLESEKTETESKVGQLEHKVETLEGEVDNLTAEKTTLTDENSALQSNVNNLEEETSNLQSTIDAWRTYAIGALIIGLLIGIIVVYLTKR